MKLKFRKFRWFGRRCMIAWRFASDGKWVRDGRVRLLSVGRFKTAEPIDGFSIIILGLGIWVGWVSNRDELE